MHLSRATFAALQQASAGLTRVAGERVREEMLKLLVGERVVEAFEVLRRGHILAVVLPELLEGWRKRQNQFHRYDIYHHMVQSVHHSPRRERVRLAALLHDIAKPRVRQRRRGAFHFHGHAKASALLAAEIMQRWKMSNQQIQDITVLTANHMLMDTDRWQDAAVRRLIARVGTALLDDLLDLAGADHLAHGTADSDLAHLDHLRTRIAAQLRQGMPLQVRDLAISGHDIMRLRQMPPGPEVGEILRALQQTVLKHPEYNRRDILLERVRDWKRP
jgi:tRNA nucleotidyltransferase/poly(A) polymerase